MCGKISSLGNDKNCQCMCVCAREKGRGKEL
jgi:hypothetical protein